MKKLFLLIALFPFSILNGQTPEETILQPKEIEGRRLNAVGEITKTYSASFSHKGDGKLLSLYFPEYNFSTNYAYDGDFVIRIANTHAAGYPVYSDWIDFTYENERIRYMSHIYDAMNADEYWEYTYYDNGRLASKCYGSYHPNNYCCCWQYDYENNGKTKIVSYYANASWGDMALGYIETHEYDDEYNLLSVRKDTYNANSEIYKSERTLYNYNPKDMLESEVGQILTDGEWINTTIKNYVYGEDGRVCEEQSGIWSSELEDWTIDHKFVKDYSVENLTYMVTFYKKQADEWVYDVFSGQNLFPEPELKEHQRAMSCFVYEEMNGSANVNQFVFHLEETCVPIYLSSAEHNQDTRYKVFPNPGSNRLQVAAPSENAIIRIYDLNGRLVCAQPFDFSATIQTDGWVKGIYIWEIWDGFNKACSGKWIKTM